MQPILDPTFRPHSYGFRPSVPFAIKVPLCQILCPPLLKLATYPIRYVSKQFIQALAGTPGFAQSSIRPMLQRQTDCPRAAMGGVYAGSSTRTVLPAGSPQ